MRKYVCIGDVHGRFDLLWAALRASFCADSEGRPTAPLKEGRYHLVLIGDLVHPKSREDYARLAAVEPGEFDHRNPEHLAAVAGRTVAEIRRVRSYLEECGDSATILLGNHDWVAVEPGQVLEMSDGLEHLEFDPARGGVALPDDLKEWFRGMPRELVVDGVQFSHAGPTPPMREFDMFFHADDEPRTWWRKKPHLVEDVGHRFGVYGHTVMPDGIYLDPQGRFAMVDALRGQGQYLEMIVGDGDPQLRVLALG